MGQSASRTAAEVEGQRTVVFERGAESSLSPSDPADAALVESKPFPSNFVRVSKYSNYLVLVFSFTLLDFFTQAANIYFLLIGALQLIPAISTTNGLPTTWGPLVFVYLVSLVREILEERSRRAEQRAANEGQRTSVLRPGASAFEDVAWQDVSVGDIVRVESDSFFPADLILLGAVHGSGDSDDGAAASEEDAKARRAKMASCHVDTASLDGESNLKKFVAVSPATAELVQDEARLIGATFRAQLGPSMRDLAKLEGALVAAATSAGTVLPAGGSAPAITASTKGNATVLLRECKLRNCERVYGLCAFTGPQTFIKQQAKKTPAKPVFLSAAINAFVRIMLAVQVALCLAGAIGSTVFSFRAGSTQWYLSAPFDPVGFVLRFFTYAQLTSQIIPISLYVSMEMARFAQRLFMEADDDMLHVTSDPDEPNVPCKVRSLQLNDQLGQVTHVFSDKTGTLTRNSFEFRKLTVGGRAYGSGTTEIAVIAARGRAKTKEDREAAAAKDVLLQRGLEAMNRPGKVLHVNFLEDADDGPRLPGPAKLADALAASMAVPGPDGASDVRMEHAADLDEFILALVLNSTVDIEPSEPGTTRVKLAGDSSDEVCFAYAASAFGYRLVRRGFSPDGFPTIEMEAPPAPGRPRSDPPRTVVRHLLHVNEFNSARGMMSVVIEDPSKAADAPDRVTLYVKGSDKKVVQSLYDIPDYVAMAKAAHEEEDETRAEAMLAEAQHHAAQALMRERTRESCVAWSEDGFRTLAFARRRMPLSEFLEWLPTLKQARTRGKEAADAFLAKHPDDEHGADKLKRRAVAEATAELEKDLVYHGAVGYEDSLQEGVPDCVARLTDAGIKVVMLTGDKEGTALNIGFGVQMLTNETEILSLTYEGREAAVFGAASAADALAPEAEQLRVLAATFRRGAAACDDIDEEVVFEWSPDEEGGMDTPGPAAVAPRGSAADSAGTADGVRAAAVAVPLSPGREAAIAGGAGLLQLGREPQLQRAIALLSPTRREDGTVDAVEVSRAAAVVRELRAELRRVTGRLQAYMDGSAGGEAESQRLRRDIVHFVLALDAALHAVRFKGGTSRPLALVLDERAMTFFLDWPGYAEIRANPEAFDPAALELQASKRLSLLALMQQCTSIIGARCQPSQKRTVLELFKEEVRGACCVGIGDGANDVEMINAANVGVGIKGVEGNSAANSADYAIGQFRFLQRLLLVHGRWNYRRMCLLILFLFYKNCLFAFAQFLFGTASGWSGQKLYGELANQGYNLFFTGAAVIAVAVLDQDVDQDSAQRFPALYADGRERRLFSPTIAVAWLLNAVVEGTVTYLLVVSAMSVIGGDGYTDSVFELGTVAMCIVVCVANIRLAAETYQHETIMVVCTLLSSLAWPGLAFAADALDFDGTLGVMSKVFGSGAVWLLLPVGVFVVMAPAMLAKVVISVFTPDYATIVRETEFFIRKGQQSLQFAPMVETDDTRELRAGGRLRPEARRLERADRVFDRSNVVTRATMGIERRIDTVKERLADRAMRDEAHAAAAAQDDAASAERAAAGAIVVSDGNSGSLALVQRAAERRSKSKDGGAPASVQRSTSRPAGRSVAHGAARPDREALRWAEQEASLILQPIESRLEQRLREEERTRLSYPLHFYRSAAMRKRIANLVQQGRIPAEAVGLRPFPDDDVVFGGGADADESGPKTAEEVADAAGRAAHADESDPPAAAAASGAAAGAKRSWRTLGMAVRLHAVSSWLKRKQDDDGAGGDVDGATGTWAGPRDEPPRRGLEWTASAPGLGKPRRRSMAAARRGKARWQNAQVAIRDLRPDLALDARGQSGSALRIEEVVSRALMRSGTSERAMGPVAARAALAAPPPGGQVATATPSGVGDDPHFAASVSGVASASGLRHSADVQPRVDASDGPAPDAHAMAVQPPGRVDSMGASTSLLAEQE